MPDRIEHKRSKASVLAEEGTLNPAPEKVSDPKFQEDGFFDPRDIVQVKYEMLRRVSVGRVRQCSLIAFVKLMVSATRLMVLFEVRTAPPQHGVGWVEPANVVYAVADRGRARAC